MGKNFKVNTLLYYTTRFSSHACRRVARKKVQGVATTVVTVTVMMAMVVAVAVVVVVVAVIAAAATAAESKRGLRPTREEETRLSRTMRVTLGHAAKCYRRPAVDRYLIWSSCTPTVAPNLLAF